MENIERCMHVVQRLRELGEEYRCIVPKKERSYTRWCEFLAGREPLLVKRDVVEVDGAEW